MANDWPLRLLECTVVFLPALCFFASALIQEVLVYSFLGLRYCGRRLSDLALV